MTNFKNQVKRVLFKQGWHLFFAKKSYLKRYFVLAHVDSFTNRLIFALHLFQVLIALFCAMFGVFGFGMYPLGRLLYYYLLCSFWYSSFLARFSNCLNFFIFLLPFNSKLVLFFLLTGLELSVEATYPTDESIGTALIFLSGQVIILRTWSWISFTFQERILVKFLSPF